MNSSSLVSSNSKSAQAQPQQISEQHHVAQAEPPQNNVSSFIDNNIDATLNNQGRQAIRIENNDTNATFKYDENATMYANMLLNVQNSALDDDDVECFNLSTGLQTKDTESPQLFTRKHTRALVADAYSWMSKRPHHHAFITGSFGIGKSRSVAIMLKLLLQNNKVVVYKIGEKSKVFIFLPSTCHSMTGYLVYSCFISHGSLAVPCCALLNSDNYCLIDPNNTGKHRTELAHTVLFATLNHPSANCFKTSARVMNFLMPAWELNELKQMNKYMMPMYRITEDALEYNYKCFGGRPLFIFSLLHNSSIGMLEEQQIDVDLFNGALSMNEISRNLQWASNLLFVVKIRSLQFASGEQDNQPSITTTLTGEPQVFNSAPNGIPSIYA